MTSLNPDCFEDVALITCQFEKEVKAIRWEWPKQGITECIYSFFSSIKEVLRCRLLV